MNQLATLLGQLIAIPSATGEEAAILRNLEERFASLSPGKAGVWSLQKTSGGLVVSSGVEGEKEARRPLVILAGHVDTVAPQGAIGPKIIGGTLYGLGSSDMKSGLAVMTHLGLTLDIRSLPVRLALVYYTGEEGPFEQNGLGRLMNELPHLKDASLAILLEPTANAIELGCLGTMNIEVLFRGETCHSARPWMGRSAVTAAVDWIREMSLRPSRDRIVEGLTFVETMAITILQSGTARNVIPGLLKANVNIRYAPDRDEDSVLEEFSSTLPEEAEWNVIDMAPPGRIDTGAPTLREFLDIVDVPRRAKQGWTDVARFSAAGIPALNFGPGLPEYCHRKDEQIPLANLDESARLLRRFLESAGCDY
ncbi:MAG: succinyl-diaminopimelate desuccinylase [Candidatus Eisenbacteria bacterium]|uniref:Succinyl-diaminopimelate desuccinylase n=1 Tax=Eiseniibacteriota bacterium TaxID=2212470 RepID=A0A948S0E1_UNCEI|nr:succinyl-diaminopimelate desuccinylase [Candidatus Eisenbacteria bacterium]MBU1950481.1 succinyl-diaminopimelate desuccinylase [Candidatus Eisenbacteria bacterium]MBU2692532.1 succinyl-diaminopimelate desuccinylase [Candidatus Eisenbacteria bacterium]